MAVTQRHSSTFEALLDVDARLTNATFPKHPTTNLTPLVGRENERGADPQDEEIDILARVEDNASVEWVLVGAGAAGRRDERFWIDIQIYSMVPGKSRRAALERLADLTAVVEDLFYDPDTGASLQVGGDAAWASNLGGIRQVVPEVVATDEGWVGSCLISIAVAARI